MDACGVLAVRAHCAQDEAGTGSDTVSVSDAAMSVSRILDQSADVSVDTGSIAGPTEPGAPDAEAARRIGDQRSQQAAFRTLANVRATACNTMN